MAIRKIIFKNGDCLVSNGIDLLVINDGDQIVTRNRNTHVLFLYNDVKEIVFMEGECK